MNPTKIVPEVTIKTPTMHYMDELCYLRCAPDLLALNLFPNAKEITESFGAFNAIRRMKKDKWKFSDPTIQCYCVGDGHVPRTAATFAFRTAWKCYSVDPKLNSTKWDTIDRLFAFKCQVELLDTVTWDKVVIVCVHSHARLDTCIKSIHAKEYLVVAIPCCVPQEIKGIEPVVVYKDWGILSEKRTVKIWEFGK
jgi:hypothetical protein